jgi:homoserine dehydrogenase
METINIGMIGGGTVGSGVFHHWQTNGALMASRLGVKLNIARVAVKALDRRAPTRLPNPS